MCVEIMMAQLMGDEAENQAQFAHARWRLAIVIPAWTGQVAILLGIMGIFCYRLAETLDEWDAMREAGDVPRVELV